MVEETENLPVLDISVSDFIINSIENKKNPKNCGYVVTIDGIPKYYSLSIQKCLYIMEILADAYKNKYFNDYNIRVEITNDKITVYKKHKFLLISYESVLHCLELHKVFYE